MRSKRYIFVEKPVFWGKTFYKLSNYKKKLFIGYNRLS